MLLSASTRTIYLTAKKNLTCPVDQVKPERLREELEASDRVDALRGQASMDQLSLLRTSMRADIEIYSGPYDGDLSDDDIDFLVACDVDLCKPPWRDAIAKQGRRSDRQPERRTNKVMPSTVNCLGKRLRRAAIRSGFLR